VVQKAKPVSLISQGSLEHAYDSAHRRSSLFQTHLFNFYCNQCVKNWRHLANPNGSEKILIYLLPYKRALTSGRLNSNSIRTASLNICVSSASVERASSSSSSYGLLCDQLGTDKNNMQTCFPLQVP